MVLRGLVLTFFFLTFSINKNTIQANEFTLWRPRPKKALLLHKVENETFNTYIALIPEKKTLRQVSEVSLCNVYAFREDKLWYVQLIFHFTSRNYSSCFWAAPEFHIFSELWNYTACSHGVTELWNQMCSVPSKQGSNFIILLKTYVRTCIGFWYFPVNMRNALHKIFQSVGRADACCGCRLGKKSKDAVLPGR